MSDFDRGDLDQRALWNGIYRRELGRDGQPDADRSGNRVGPSEFARRAAALLPSGSTVLELGCGRGVDAAYFAARGHPTTAVDFSEVVVESNRARYTAPGAPRFLAADLAEPLPFAADEFDLVYARLSLHYFPDGVTRRILGEIWRVLRPHGLLCFMCRSVEDPLCGRGERVGPDTYVLNGHVRHFFGAAYVSSLLAPSFALQAIGVERSNLYGRPSAYVEVVARKAPPGVARPSTPPGGP